MYDKPGQSDHFIFNPPGRGGFVIAQAGQESIGP
jgi:hypothetical protein